MCMFIQPQLLSMPLVPTILPMNWKNLREQYRKFNCTKSMEMIKGSLFIANVEIDIEIGFNSLQRRFFLKCYSSQIIICIKSYVKCDALSKFSISFQFQNKKLRKEIVWLHLHTMWDPDDYWFVQNYVTLSPNFLLFFIISLKILRH